MTPNHYLIEAAIARSREQEHTVREHASIYVMLCLLAEESEDGARMAHAWEAKLVEFIKTGAIEAIGTVS